DAVVVAPLVDAPAANQESQAERLVERAKLDAELAVADGGHWLAAALTAGGVVVVADAGLRGFAGWSHGGGGPGAGRPAARAAGEARGFEANRGWPGGVGEQEITADENGKRGGREKDGCEREEQACRAKCERADESAIMGKAMPGGAAPLGNAVDQGGDKGGR